MLMIPFHAFYRQRAMSTSKGFSWLEDMAGQAENFLNQVCHPIYIDDAVIKPKVTRETYERERDKLFTLVCKTKSFLNKSIILYIFNIFYDMTLKLYYCVIKV